MTIFISSDCHFSHFNIIKYCNRPFSTIAEMNDTIIKNFNSVIHPTDTLYHLGDFTMSGNYNYIASLARRINGKKIFLLGNHDKRGNFQKLVDDGLIISFHDVLGISINKQYIWLSHYPHRSIYNCYGM